MKYYSGLDVSMKTTSICVIDQNGSIVFEETVVTDPACITNTLKATGFPLEKVALESGAISHWLVQKLRLNKIPVVCIDARKMSKVLAINVNKTDKNDAHLIAEVVRCNFYSEVIQKSQGEAEINILLSSRRTLLNTVVTLKNTIRGHLKVFGIRLLSVKHSNFAYEVMKHVQDKSEVTKTTFRALLETFEKTLDQLKLLEREIEKAAKEDEDVKLLMTIPGIGRITAFTFKISLGNPARFKKSRAVGAYYGLTPRQYSSGEKVQQGRISKCGSDEMRALLHEAATALLYCTKSFSRIKAWGLKLRQKKGHKKAATAVGRKLCTVMHSMLISRKPFEYGEPKQTETDKLEKVS